MDLFELVIFALLAWGLVGAVVDGIKWLRRQ